MPQPDVRLLADGFYDVIGDEELESLGFAVDLSCVTSDSCGLCKDVSRVAPAAGGWRCSKPLGRDVRSATVTHHVRPGVPWWLRLQVSLLEDLL